jgi:putative endonuclease
VSRPPAFDRQPHARARGRSAEDDAVAYLRRRGYEVLERNLTTEAGEIDVIARDGETLCFIEVKARKGSSHGTAVEAVRRPKQRKIARAAALYLARTGSEVPCRFDVLGMDRRGDGWEYTLLRDAFEVS